MTAYRYIFADLLTNVVIGELPLTGISYTQALNGAGAAQGRINIANLDAAKMNILAATQPNKCALYIDRNGVIVWGGILRKRSYKSKDQAISLIANEFEDYFSNRLILGTNNYVNTDQLVVAKALINNAQAQPNGNIGVQVGAETSPILVNQNYYGYAKQNVLSELQALSNAAQGFDFNISCSYDANYNIIKTLHLGYPRIGKPYSVGNLANTVIELPSNVTEYEYDEDGSTQADSVYVTGSGSNEGKLVSNVQRTDLLSAGWALQEVVKSYATVSDQTLLNTLSSGLAQALGMPPVIIKVTIPAGIDPIVGTYG